MYSINILYNSYEEALASCGKGYDDDEVSRLIVAKTISMKDKPTSLPLDADPLMVFSTAIARIASSGKSSIRILDFGGAAGYHFFFARSILPSIDLRWAIVETPAMVRNAAPILSDEQLSFHLSIPDALHHLGGCDLVYTSGAIQYHPFPETAIDMILSIEANDAIIARFPLFDGQRAIGVQSSMLKDNGLGPLPNGFENKEIRYPITFINKLELAKKMLYNYELRAQFHSPTANYLVNGTAAFGSTFLLRHR